MRHLSLEVSAFFFFCLFFLLLEAELAKYNKKAAKILAMKRASRESGEASRKKEDSDVDQERIQINIRNSPMQLA